MFIISYDQAGASFVSYRQGTYKVWNEIETKRNEINKNETKSTKWKRNKTKPTKAKWNQRKQNEIDWYEENGRKKIKDKTK